MANSESGIWAACAGQTAVTTVAGRLVRFVESQEQVATNRLVSTLADQALLESLLETSKPARPAATLSLHYLLATPFRYPPLRHGSRFGYRHERSLFYGSLTEATVLAEAAYYRLVFWYGMAVPPTRPMTTQHTLFAARYASESGIKLHQPPFTVWQTELTQKDNYSATQPLGHAMREAGINAFEYISARDPNTGINVALFTPDALTSTQPEMMQNWLAETTGERVGFYCSEIAMNSHFELQSFLVNGVLPAPAV